jgi:GT2 family glycosyltransferase
MLRLLHRLRSAVLLRSIGRRRVAVPEAMPLLPKLSIVVVVHQMRRAARRTFQSLAIPYQRGVAATDYEVIVVDNGSEPAVRLDEVEGFGPQFRLLVLHDAAPSPAAAVNAGVAHARAERLCVMIDGARLVTPGLVATMIAAARIDAGAVIAAPGWHLGPDLQWRSLEAGYSEGIEDDLLAQADWMSDGYRLFRIGVPGASSSEGALAPMAECNTLGLSRRLFDRLEGMDERFDLPGGGYVNLDFYRRAVMAAGSKVIVLPGEASFHQLHGGVSTNAAVAERLDYDQRARRQYRQLRGDDFSPAGAAPLLFGGVPDPALEALGLSLAAATARVRVREPALSMLFCIDAEQDDFMPMPGAARPWDACARLLASIDAVRRDLAAACGHGVLLNWFLRGDPQIELAYGDAGWGMRRYLPEWRRLAACGDLLGVHPHPQRWDAAQGRWHAPSSDGAWVSHCLDVAVEAFVDVFDAPPRAMRFGNRFTSRALLQRAAERGIDYDLTAEPGYAGRLQPGADDTEVGPCPDYRAWPRTPFRAGSGDPSRPGCASAGTTWTVPMSSVRTSTASVPAAYETLMLRLDPELFRRALDAALARTEPGYLAFVARSDMFELEEGRANLATLMNHPHAHRLKFETPVHTLARLGLASG